MTTPFPPDASTIIQPSGQPSGPPPPDAQSQAGVVPPGATGPERPRTPRAPRIPGMRRRLALLATALYMPIILVGYTLYLHGPTDCVAGPLCSLGDAPAFAQALLTALGFVLLYFIGVRPLAALLDERQPARSEVARTLRRAARFETIRPLLALFGGLIALTLLVGIGLRTLTFPAFVIGASVAALLFTLAALAEPSSSTTPPA